MSLNLREYLNMLIQEHGLVAVLEETISMEGLVPVVAALKECVPNEIVVAENDARRTWDRLDTIACRVHFLERE